MLCMSLTKEIYSYIYIKYTKENLRFKACSGAQMETEAWLHTTCTTSTLLKVGLRRPHSCIISHVVMNCEKLYFLPAIHKTVQ